MQSNGKAENTIAKAMHRDARQCNAMQWNGSEQYRIAAEWRSTAMLDVATEMQ